jgi:hypothetical protein
VLILINSVGHLVQPRYRPIWVNWISMMQDVEPGWDKVLRIVWLLTWRGLVGGVVIGFLLGLAINLVLGLGFGLMLGTNVNAAMGLVVMLAWWPFVVRMALMKRYRDFRIVLMPQGRQA